MTIPLECSLVFNLKNFYYLKACQLWNLVNIKVSLLHLSGFLSILIYLTFPLNFFTICPARINLEELFINDCFLWCYQKSNCFRTPWTYNLKIHEKFELDYWNGNLCSISIKWSSNTSNLKDHKNNLRANRVLIQQLSDGRGFIYILTVRKDEHFSMMIILQKNNYTTET